MAKRQERIKTERLSAFSGKSIPLNFITKTGSVLHGTLTSFVGEILKVKNTRGKNHALHLREIDEIWAEWPA